ncbi:MAG: preprotein translocase subunit SecE [Cyanobacteria bacterium P01_C01_bin.89]
MAKKANASAQAKNSPPPIAFLQGTKEELGKVVWPSRQQLISESVAVILMVTLSATTIYLLDNLFGWLARQVFG